MAEKLFSLERGPEGELIVHLKHPRLWILPEFRGHLRSAGKEVLLAFRSLLDETISAIEKEEKQRSRKRTEIKVE
ncbi:MAG: hypothetical protein DRI26_01320 [Chloroflexi bacterium]|nr:MAG: hypothetical protein DRI26_01320 [Chloroflexota bacterium]